MYLFVQVSPSNMNYHAKLFPQTTKYLDVSHQQNELCNGVNMVIW
jgi:hypothetical protein